MRFKLSFITKSWSDAFSHLRSGSFWQYRRCQAQLFDLKTSGRLLRERNVVRLQSARRVCAEQSCERIERNKPSAWWRLLRARAIRREKGDALELGLVKIKKPYTRRGCLAGRYLWYCATDLGGRQLTPQMITDARNVQVCLAVTKSTAFKCFFQWITEAVFKLGWQGLSLLPSNQQHTALKIPNWYNTNWAVI